MTATLEVTDLRKQFAVGRPAIDGVSFAVPAGEIVVLLGPSGCGKTTTLRCVAGLEHPTDGEISIAGRVVSPPTSHNDDGTPVATPPPVIALKGEKSLALSELRAAHEGWFKGLMGTA